MEDNPSIPNPSYSSSNKDTYQEPNNHDGVSDLDQDINMLSLPKESGWFTSELYMYQGFWCIPHYLPGIVSAQRQFRAHENDIIVASAPKSGTTWLKALAFTILNRLRFPDLSNIPLLTTNPHDLVPFLEYEHVQVDLPKFESPRLYATHIPYNSLPEIIKKSDCIRIVYICRNPYDIFVSSWKFYSANRDKSLGELSLDEAFEMFCRGGTNYGPIWDHVSGFQKESLKRPQKILFLMYEEMKEDIVLHTKRLAEFIGVPFSSDEEREGVIDKISRMCSFKSLSELDVNKNGKFGVFKKRTLFRRGEVGDWTNHFSPEMVERLKKVIEEKFDGSSIVFLGGV